MLPVFLPLRVDPFSHETRVYILSFCSLKSHRYRLDLMYQGSRTHTRPYMSHAKANSVPTQTLSPARTRTLNHKPDSGSGSKLSCQEQQQTTAYAIESSSFLSSSCFRDVGVVMMQGLIYNLDSDDGYGTAASKFLRHPETVFHPITQYCCYSCCRPFLQEIASVVGEQNCNQQCQPAQHKWKRTHARSTRR